MDGPDIPQSVAVIFMFFGFIMGFAAAGGFNYFIDALKKRKKTVRLQKTVRLKEKKELETAIHLERYKDRGPDGSTFE